MEPTLNVGIALIVLGAAVVGYDRFSYTTTENFREIGSIAATAERTHPVSLPPIFGWLLVGNCASVLAFAVLSKKDRKEDVPL